MRVILVLDWAYVNGGQAKVALDSAYALKARGHEPIVFAAVGPVDPALQAAGIEVHCLNQPELLADPNKAAAALRGIHNREAARALHALLKAQPRGETVIHVHGWAKALSAAIAGPIRASKLPVLYTMHEYFLLCPNGGFYNYRAHHHCPLTPLSLACLATHCDSRTFGYKLWRSARLGVARFIQRLPATLGDIAYFHPFQRAIIEKHLPASARLHEVANPIEAEPLGEKEDGAAGEIIFLGRLSEEKGVFLYASAMRKAGLTPVFVGDGPAVPMLKARFPEATFLGWHDAKGVRRRLREARALVFPSLWYEGQPLTVLESLSLGTPVITSDGCAGRESVRDGETGLWFRHMDEEDLARAIRVLMRDDVARAMSEAAYRRYWTEPFTIDRHCARLEAVYGEMLARKAA
ncbi:MAG: glycosyltransferase family 4 protein [Beijerinckiaceae bacterium]|jgi:glycosyltransferase involved in cell wall biosynthesis|nr:glycosyltransferase family 4 protein [Beijerinckiaceae bacterium]